jgi:GTPase SAR1 family protein
MKIRRKHFEIAFSFAGEYRCMADKIVSYIREHYKKHLSIFLDVEKQGDYSGQNRIDYFSNVYKNATLLIVLLSSEYLKKSFTNDIEKPVIYDRISRNKLNSNNGDRFLMVFNVEPNWICDDSFLNIRAVSECSPETIAVEIIKRYREISKLTLSSKGVDTYYKLRVLPSSHDLVDRNTEREKLINPTLDSYLVVGPSNVGKTQLVKKVIHELSQGGRSIFWFKFENTKDPERQRREIFEALSQYFYSEFNNDSLEKYFESHGTIMTLPLSNLLANLIEKYKPIVVIDDIQKCIDDDSSLRLILLFISLKACRIYIIGWDNVDKNGLPLIKEGTITTVQVFPLCPIYIMEIARGIKPSISEDDLNFVVNRSEGLPGYAKILPEDQDLRNHVSLSDFFINLLIKLPDVERSLLFALAMANNDISEKDLRTISTADTNFLYGASQLVAKRIIEKKGLFFSLHDKYKESIKRNLLYSDPLLLKIISSCAESDITFVLHKLELFKFTNNAVSYIKCIRDNLQRLIDSGCDVELLNNIQDADLQNNGILHFTNMQYAELRFTKAVILERKGEYDVVGLLLDNLSTYFDTTHPSYQYYRYIKLRFLYFKGEYYTLFSDFFSSFNEYKSFSKELYLQILFLIGRTLYVVGEIKAAAEIYYFIAIDAYDDTS